MKLLKVRSVVEVSPGHYDCRIDVEWAPGEPPETNLEFRSTPDDPYGFGPEVRRRIAAGEIEGRVMRP